jgi:translation initiation factor 2 subunit 1
MFAPDGIDIIKEALKRAENAGNGKIAINYLGSGLYRLMIKAPDYKEAEKLMKNATESAIALVTKHEGMAEFSRDSA